MSDKACIIRGKAPVANSENPGSSVRKPFQFQPTKKIKIAEKLSEGNKVLHAKFGVGLIKQKLGIQVFRVAFEDHNTMNIRCDYLSLL